MPKTAGEFPDPGSIGVGGGKYVCVCVLERQGWKGLPLLRIHGPFKNKLLACVM